MPSALSYFMILGENIKRRYSETLSLSHEKGSSFGKWSFALSLCSLASSEAGHWFGSEISRIRIVMFLLVCPCSCSKCAVCFGNIFSQNHKVREGRWHLYLLYGAFEGCKAKTIRLKYFGPLHDKPRQRDAIKNLRRVSISGKCDRGCQQTHCGVLSIITRCRLKESESKEFRWIFLHATLADFSRWVESGWVDFSWSSNISAFYNSQASTSKIELLGIRRLHQKPKMGYVVTSLWRPTSHCYCEFPASKIGVWEGTTPWTLRGGNSKALAVKTEHP